MYTFDTNRGTVQVEVDAPQGGTKGIREAGFSLIIERIGLAKDERNSASVGPDRVVLNNVGFYGAHGLRVVQERPLECDAW